MLTLDTVDHVEGGKKKKTNQPKLPNIKAKTKY